MPGTPPIDAAPGRVQRLDLAAQLLKATCAAMLDGPNQRILPGLLGFGASLPPLSSAQEHATGSFMRLHSGLILTDWAEAAEMRPARLKPKATARETIFIRLVPEVGTASFKHGRTVSAATVVAVFGRVDNGTRSPGPADSCCVAACY
ncbi:MAG: hypothetical protein DI527_06385 [Chelatococcus sp.]|nr:MAG: hypothetical protein DI527_06385 [Chelatococcus sp.]